jgi:hypothetical protein
MRIDELKVLLDRPWMAKAVLESLASRMTVVPSGWDAGDDGAVCECGLLLTVLPRPVWVRRVVVVDGRAVLTSEQVRHAHVSPGLCLDCWRGDLCGELHAVTACDVPCAVVCGVCGDGDAVPGMEVCRCCVPVEVEWDADSYYGTP